MVFSESELALVRQKLRFKVRFHVGSFCQEVDDLVQETLMRFVNAANGGAIHNPERYGAFLNGICNNVIREWRRARREPAYDALVHGEPSVNGDGERLVLRDEVRSALEQLMPRDAEILREFYLEQKPKEEICRSHMLTDAQFRVVIFRAKKRFRTVYDTAMKHLAGEPH